MLNNAAQLELGLKKIPAGFERVSIQPTVA